jgi:hypothetical protein
MQGNDFDLRMIPIAEYRDGAYVRSWSAPGAATYIDNDLVDTLYIPYTSLPIPMGATFDDRSATLRGESFIRELDKTTYLIGNKIIREYNFFELFGNLYAYSDGSIWLAPISSTGYVQALQPIAAGQALQLIATAPTLIYFLSSFDNSLYSFDGGRALTKGVRLNSLPAVTKGVYSVTENSLVLDATSKILFVRDGIVSAIDKNADQLAGISFSVADNGVHIICPSNRYKYNYNAIGNVQPLKWRSAFWGGDATKQQYIKSAVYTVYSALKELVTVSLFSQTFDEGQTFPEQREDITINPIDYSDGGYARVRFQPIIQRGLGTSYGFECSSKVVLLDIGLEVVEVEPAAIAASRSV